MTVETLASERNTHICDELTAYHFIFKLFCLTILPLILAVGLLAAIVWRSGAGLSATRIALLQLGDPQIGWVGPLELYSGVKLARLKLSTPDVVVIGASRGGEIRSAMFKPYSFYNGSMVGWGLDRIYQVLDDVTRDRSPKVVILTIDFTMFGPGYEARWRPYEDLMPLNFGTFSAYREGIASLGESLALSPKLTIRDRIRKVEHGPIDEPDKNLDGLRLLGPYTQKSQNAFRYDGSLAYFPSFLEQLQTKQTQFVNVLALVDPGTGTGIDPLQMRRMQRIAALARKRGFILIGVQMPFPASVVRIFDGYSDYSENHVVYKATDRALWRAFETHQMEQALRAMGVPFFDFSRIPEAGDTKLFLDLAHPGEYLALVSMIDLLKTPYMRTALPKIDISSLELAKHRAEDSRNYFDIFANVY